MMDRLEVLTQVLTCTRCELHAQCTLPVAASIPEGTVEIAVVGEAPGEAEDKAGAPFVGPAGQHLRDALAEALLEPDTLAYVNTVSCFPHGTPSPAHIEACAVNKQAQLNYLNPSYVLLLGQVALRATMPNLSIRHGRGRPFLLDGRIYFATYHPSAALRKAAYDTAMRNDLDRFATLVSFEPQNWHKGIPDTCSACNIEPEWWDHHGLGWCPLHVPDTERDAYEARQELIAADLDALRRLNATR